MTVTRSDVLAAAELLAGVATLTPVEDSRALRETIGAPVGLKCENLQRTGSFKLRGAYVRLARLTAAERARGVVAASAGNHAQGVAMAAGMLGIRSTVFMPTDAALPKVAATREYGARVELTGVTLADALSAAQAEAERTGALFIHPYDHPDVIAGQGTIGLEMLEQIPGLSTVVVPLGGGGLVAGIAAALEGTGVRVVGVQAAAVAPWPGSLAAGAPTAAEVHTTMADGIAVPNPGREPFAVIASHNVEVVTVGEEHLSQALLLVAERAKLVVEPSGAAGVAALLAAPELFADDSSVGVVLSGGNIDPLVLMRVLRHGLASAGRFLYVRVRLSDRPGALAQLVSVLARDGGNVMHVDHVRTGADLAIDEVEVAFQVETKGPAHCRALLDGLVARGYHVIGAQD